MRLFLGLRFLFWLPGSFVAGDPIVDFAKTIQSPRRFVQVIEYVADELGNGGFEFLGSNRHTSISLLPFVLSLAAYAAVVVCFGELAGCRRSPLLRCGLTCSLGFGSVIKTLFGFSIRKAEPAKPNSL